MRIAVIGSGVSGIAAGKTLKRLGHEVVLFERTRRIGGVWAVAYPGVRLQNMAELYAFTDYPWPFDAGDYPGAADILRYLEMAVAHFGLEVRLGHEVKALTTAAGGWRVEAATPEGAAAEVFDFVVVASGHYTGEKAEIALDGRERFRGRIVTEHEVGDFSLFDGQRVAVVGFGKSALDMLGFALGRARELHHVFREARWALPRRMFGMASSRLSTERLSSAYGGSWVYPDPKVAAYHQRNPKTAAQTDAVQSHAIRLAEGLRGIRFDRKARVRLALIDPAYPVGRQLRGTMAPDGYFRAIARGAIEPYRAALAGFSGSELLLADGSAVAADVVALALGYKRPSLPFLPPGLGEAFAGEADGMQLYRHILHPDYPTIGFAGFNHNPLHIPSAEIAALWMDAVMTGALALPPTKAMAASAGRVRDWKRTNTIFEPTRAYWVGGHVHNYLDVLLDELGLDPRRKPNRLAEMMAPYAAADYATIIDEYERARGTPRVALPYDT